MTGTPDRDIRAWDAEREQAAAELGPSVGEGRLTLAEHQATWINAVPAIIALLAEDPATTLARWDGLGHRWPGTGWVDPDATARQLIWRFLTSRPAQA